ncbi:MAG: WD40 repeat domain-containing protein [Rhodospirillales bacterium]|nr:WD40 repeat domain-containing protein [Rhodospirillales bacterium]
MRSLGAYVVGLTFLESGILAAALGDGRVAFFGPGGVKVPSIVAAHSGACLSLAADFDGRGVLTGGDDGRLVRTDIAGEVTQLLSVPGRWVEPIAVSAASGLRATAMGKTAYLVERDGALAATFDHANAVAGLAFDPKGRRLAAGHYGGVSLWWAKQGAQEPKRLRWTGSHLALTWSPDGKYIVTTMQGNELHGWRLSDGTDMRMSGYPGKVKSMTWLPRGRYLATSGAESVVCWPYHGKLGPMGKAPLELGLGFESIVTAVAAHPRDDFIAAGYEDGTAVLLPIDGARAALVKPPGDGAVTALAWSADGRDLAIGNERWKASHE